MNASTKSRTSVAKFEEFVSSIEAGDSAEMLVRKALNIGE